MSFSGEDARYMARALQLARRGLYTTDPNPRVGCVIVQGDRIVGEGFHLRAGEPHAEVLALQQAGPHAHGATVYVTLEPCCHQGRTPPCSDALLKVRVRRVVAAMRDPNPQVAGKGLEALEAQGVAVQVGLMEGQAKELNPGFIERMKNGRPFVRVKLAASLDGRTALAGGESRWITGEAARADVQRWRARSSAVLTGISTVLADDPRLNVRDETIGDIGRQPLRIVVDGHLRLPPTAQLLRLPGKTLVVAVADEDKRAGALRAAGAEVVFIPGADGKVDLAALMHHLGTREINEVLVEAGSTLCGALLKQRLVDELVSYYAPYLLGSDSRGMFQLPPLARMDDRLALEIKDVRAIGRDWRIVASIAK
jgi:diaminohydroxyphosphoribosylaminopyrimidine deaminase/5-amino-6-(5-phosphoribosylamino)uracil reductase